MADLWLNGLPSLFPLSFESAMLYGGSAGLVVGGIILAFVLRSELSGKRPKPIPLPRAKYHRG